MTYEQLKENQDRNNAVRFGFKPLSKSREKHELKQTAINTLMSNALSNCPDVMNEFNDDELIKIGKIIMTATYRSSLK